MSAVAIAPPSVYLVVGNTYQRLPDSEARLNRDGTHRKVHDWVLFVDITEGNSELIKSVEFKLHPSFKPRSYLKTTPVNIVLPDGTRVSRFKTRQQSTVTFTPTIRITGRG
eukprot:15356428-Ditylum_brightwellii.AAC.1